MQHAGESAQQQAPAHVMGHGRRCSVGNRACMACMEKCCYHERQQQTTPPAAAAASSARLWRCGENKRRLSETLTCATCRPCCMRAAVPSTTCSRRRMASRHSQLGAAAVFAILTLAACVTSTGQMPTGNTRPPEHPSAAHSRSPMHVPRFAGASILDATWTLAASHRLSTSR